MDSSTNSRCPPTESAKSLGRSCLQCVRLCPFNLYVNNPQSIRQRCRFTANEFQCTDVIPVGDGIEPCHPAGKRSKLPCPPLHSPAPSWRTLLSGGRTLLTALGAIRLGPTICLLWLTPHSSPVWFAYDAECFRCPPRSVLDVD